MGHKWQLYCKLKMDYPHRLHPSPDKWNWAPAKRVLTMSKKHGMKTMPCLWPTHVPEHMLDKSMSSDEAFAEKRRIMRMYGRGKNTFPDLVKWQQYCQKVAEKLGDIINLWTLEDETEMYYSSEEVANITKATIAGFKASGKDVKVSFSCTPDFTEEILKYMGSTDGIGGLGASSYSFEYWDARKVRYLQEKHNIPWHCIGVGAGIGKKRFNHTLPDYKDIYAKTVSTAQEMIFLTLVQDAKVIGHYSGRLWVRDAMQSTDGPLMNYDGTPLPHGFTYSCIPLLLANAVPIEDIYLDKLDTIVFLYKQDGKLGACTWSNNSPGLDIHWKTEPRSWENFSLQNTAGKIIIHDMYGNPRKDIKQNGDSTVFNLTEEPCFILNNGLSDEQFIRAVRSATANPRELSMQLAFLPDGKGGVKLGIKAKNNTKSVFKNLKLRVCCNFFVHKLNRFFGFETCRNNEAAYFWIHLHCKIPNSHRVFS